MLDADDGVEEEAGEEEEEQEEALASASASASPPPSPQQQHRRLKIGAGSTLAWKEEQPGGQGGKPCVLLPFSPSFPSSLSPLPFLPSVGLLTTPAVAQSTLPPRAPRLRREDRFRHSIPTNRFLPCSCTGTEEGQEEQETGCKVEEAPRRRR